MSRKDPIFTHKIKDEMTYQPVVNKSQVLV